ncbi:MAG: TlyA family RNA methyltransferase [bacterium]|nr:TlyA family RNA methyltransferase [bacterium]MDD5353690.1 TlyA family RNA methyltransferase [bacterium]
MANVGKMRLDQLMVIRELTESREKAQALIMAGEVLVNGNTVIKAATMVSTGSEVDIKHPLMYVSRGGHKLEKALKVFNIKLKDKTCLDVGASTGGFTDCLLKHGAKKVYCIDVGYGQLDVKLRFDPRVVNIEETNIRYCEKNIIPETPDLATIDVSFISLERVLPVVYKLIKQEGEIIALIKPQFEAGPKNVGKGGVVRDPAIHEKIINQITVYSQINAMEVKGVTESPLIGPAGNKEFLIYLVKS